MSAHVLRRLLSAPTFRSGQECPHYDAVRRILRSLAVAGVIMAMIVFASHAALRQTTQSCVACHKVYRNEKK